MEKRKKERRAEMRELMEKLEVKDMGDINELFKEMVGSVLENSLAGELEEELGYSKYDYKNRATDNYRNGHSKKSVKSTFGEMEIEVPRDRNGEFEPKILKKHQTTLSGDIEEKVISMYAKGMTTSDIESHIQEIYGLEVSDSTISRITDKILPIAKEWQSRPLESIYAVVFMDAIHYHVRKEGSISKKGGIYSYWRRFEWNQGRSWYVGRREREREILA
jgi:transposase-like protein